MASRLKLHEKFKELLGSGNVYYQPPANGMQYPAIRYSISDIDIKRADDTAYLKTRCYEVIVISKTPDHPVIEKILELPHSRFSRHYIADGLNHDVLTLYF
jgi:hypothetical protein